jgi:hypothetical protein
MDERLVDGAGFRNEDDGRLVATKDIQIGLDDGGRAIRGDQQPIVIEDWVDTDIVGNERVTALARAKTSARATVSSESETPM